MRYFYEYKYKKGNRMVGGHNLEKIEFFDNYIKLSGVDIIPTNYDYEEQNWGTFLDMNEIEYLKIEPMLENRELKKQLENYKKLGFKHLQDKNNNLETQQQEFIKFLEDNYESTQDIWYIKILQKYKEINHIPDDGKKVGDDK